MADLPQYFVKLHAEVYAGATGDNVGLFDIEATGKAAQLLTSVGVLCDALAAGISDPLSRRAYEDSVAQPSPAEAEA